MPDPNPPADPTRPATMFPSLYEDHSDVSAQGQNGPTDVTGLVLPDLVEKNDTSFANGKTLSDMPGEPILEGQSAPAKAKEAVDDLGVLEGKRPKRTLQDRIDQLTRRNYEARGENEALQGQLAQLMQAVTLQQQQIAALTSRGGQSAAAPTTPSGDPLSELLGGHGAPAGTSAPASVPPSPVDVPRIVDEAISRYDQRSRAEQSRAMQLRLAQEQAFEEACEVLPALRDPRTNARKVFNQIFDRSALRNEPDAPLHIALQVKGLLADEVSRPAASPERKRAASVSVPSQSPTDSAGGPSRQDLQKALDSEMKKLQLGDSSFSTFKRARVLREMIRRTR